MTRRRVLAGLMLLMLLQVGCAAVPAFTHCTGEVSIQTDKPASQARNNGTNDRFIVATFWDEPTVNGLGGEPVVGDLILHDVAVVQSRQLTVKFPLRAYWVIWTPVLGTQHISPEPVVVVFHEDYPASWQVGDTHQGYCCSKPATQHEFQLTLNQSEPVELSYGDEELLKKLLDSEKVILKKMDRDKRIVAEDKAMVAAKLRQLAAIHSINGPQ